MLCETTDFMFPLLADIYYPIVEQGAYGNVSKTWMHDKTIACEFHADVKTGQPDVKINIDVTYRTILIGRTKKDLRVSSSGEEFAITNVLISNVRDANGNEIYRETAGVRSGKSTLFEIASSQPFVGPFGTTEFFKVTILRSENQGADV